MIFLTIKCFGFAKMFDVLIFMTLVYDNTTCIQTIFTYAFQEQNLDNYNIVFTVKNLVSNFKRVFSLLFKDDFKNQGRPKEFYLDELLGFVVYGVHNIRFCCMKLVDWINNNDESVNYILNNKKSKKSILT